MELKNLKLEALISNPENDRHGTLKSEADSIEWLFKNHAEHMINLASDIVEHNGILVPPLVKLSGKKYIVFDGNRRVTSLKLIVNPVILPFLMGSACRITRPFSVS